MEPQSHSSEYTAQAVVSSPQSIPHSDGPGCESSYITGLMVPENRKFMKSRTRREQHEYSWIDLLEKVKSLSREGELYRICGPLSAEDVAEIQDFTRSIHTIELYGAHLEILDAKDPKGPLSLAFSSVVQLSCIQPNSSPMFPNLGSLWIDQPTDFSIYPLFLSPQLRLLWIKDFPSSLKAEFICFLQALSRVGGRLRVVYLGAIPLDYGDVLDSLLAFSESLTQLTIETKPSAPNTSAPPTSRPGCPTTCPTRLYSTLLPQLRCVQGVKINFHPRAGKDCSCVPNRQRSAINVSSWDLGGTLEDINTAFSYVEFPSSQLLEFRIIIKEDDRLGSLPSLVSNIGPAAAMVTFWENVAMIQPSPLVVAIDGRSVADKNAIPTMVSTFERLLESQTTASISLKGWAGLDIGPFLPSYPVTAPATFAYLAELRLDLQSNPLPFPSLLRAGEVFPRLIYLEYPFLPVPFPPSLSSLPPMSSRTEAHPLHALWVKGYPRTRASPPLSAKDIKNIAHSLRHTFPYLGADDITVEYTSPDSRVGCVWNDVKEELLSDMNSHLQTVA